MPATLKFAPSFNFHVLFSDKQSVDLHMWRLTGFTVINQKKVSSHNTKLTFFVEEELFPERWNSFAGNLHQKILLLFFLSFMFPSFLINIFNFIGDVT